MTSVLGKVELGEGFDMLKYIFAAFVVPKSWLDPVSCTLLNASRNMALCASSRFSRKSIVDLPVKIFVDDLRALFRCNIGEEICAQISGDCDIITGPRIPRGID